MSAQGLILIDKPKGQTSRKVTTIVSKIFREKRAGHLGTLDPMATGLLPILLGKATRLASFLEADEKEYSAQIKLGEATDTMDAEGKIISSAPVPELSSEQLEKILDQFRGEIDQTPPMFSAIWHEGKRLYNLARRGETVAPKPRKITIFEMKLVSFAGTIIDLTVRCSPGTYIRVLANDIGKSIGCGAHLMGLRRLKSGRFSVDKAVELSSLTDENIGQLLIQMDELLAFPKIEVSDDEGYRIRDGNLIPFINPKVSDFPIGSMLQVYSKLCFALCEVVEKEGKIFLRPDKVFPADET